MFQALPRSILGIKCLFPWKWMMLTNCMSFSTSFLIEFVAMPTVACYRKGNMFLSREKCFSAALKSTAKYSSLFDLRPFVRNHENQLDVHVTTRGKCYFLFLRDNIFFHVHVSKSFALPIFRGHWGFQLLTQPAVCVSCWPHKINSHWIQMPHRILISVWFTLHITFHLGHTLFFTTVEYK